ncbi:Cd(II)/Pb(II)-responsive transcriptional regulator [Kushneria phosphatilytica]|uniref:Cd(II)/Pb(II)-responsive transcriptional regulator n=1 Tax=Kushneria phosphatilytica TaxID=657387 RepID=A0A1S1NZI2_9GAMM|nr:Cd(II)/Pb(II)-responsive transcriptional regulator [Kushneria phosphatilytica]OHV13802.1 Cd(II)/Pb(II)-responsive transcriptional regulator [Kushneria phosphatilytica]QEL10353.1 Cd(II)/Pb(II)-responsive transcriptional regulator [Kushneria phosphatilytica]
MKIGELASAAGCTNQTIRFYEREGLLPEPARDASNYRYYHQTHLDRLRFIRNCRALVMSHEEIRSLLELMDRPLEECQPVEDLLENHVGHVEARIRELLQLRSQLHELQRRCGHDRHVENCGIVQGLAEMVTELPPRGSTHLG